VFLSWNAAVKLPLQQKTKTKTNAQFLGASERVSEMLSRATAGMACPLPARATELLTD